MKANLMTKLVLLVYSIMINYAVSQRANFSQTWGKFTLQFTEVDGDD